MNNKPTIDGVPRELLERVILGDTRRGATREQVVDAWNAMGELRALLDAPDSKSGSLPPVERQAMWQAIDEALTGTVEPMLRGDICNILAALLVPAAQPQREPMAPFSIGIACLNPLMRRDTAIASVRISREMRGPFTEPLYAEQPA